MLQINIVKDSMEVQRKFYICINGRKQLLETTD